MRKLILTIALGVFGLVVPAGAAAAPIFNLDVHHNQTNFPPGGNQVDAFPVVFTTTQGSADANEQQGLQLQATSGTFTLSFDSDGDGPQPADPPSGALPFGASGAAVQSALESLPSIGAGNVDVSASISNDGDTSYGITFKGALAVTDVAPLIAADGSTPLAIDPEYWIALANVGPDPTSGPITVTVNLPNGITRRFVNLDSGETAPFLTWSCPGSVGDNTVVCTTTGTIPRHEFNRQLKIRVGVAAPEGAIRTLKARVSGGGAAEATAEETTPISPTPAPFGIVAPSFLPDFVQADGLTPEREAGAHPDLLTVPFDFTSVDIPTHFLGYDTKQESSSIRNLHVDAPPGFIGNPSAVGECTQAAFVLGFCPPSSQVGRIEVQTHPPISNSGDYHTFNRPVYNLTHPRGAVTDLAFVVSGNPIHIKASLDPANHYAITTDVPDINEILPPFDQKLTLWGVPADHSHDSERCRQAPPPTSTPTKSAPPTRATALPRPALAVRRRQHLAPAPLRLLAGHRASSAPTSTTPCRAKWTDCDRPRFEPDVEIEPTGKQANTPTGLDVHIKIAQNENPNALATPPVQADHGDVARGDELQPVVCRRPEELHPGPDAARQQRGSAVPDASRIGEVELSTPLLPKRLEGSMYLAAQRDNPFNSIFALLLVLHDTEERGVLVKIPGRIDVDPTTGQITTVFEDTPQFPFDDLTLKFRSGPRAPLVSPPFCGTHEIGVEVASYAQPQVAGQPLKHLPDQRRPQRHPVPAQPRQQALPPGLQRRHSQPRSRRLLHLPLPHAAHRRRTGTEPGGGQSCHQAWSPRSPASPCAPIRRSTRSPQPRGQGPWSKPTPLAPPHPSSAR